MTLKSPSVVRLRLPWREPLDVLARFAEEPFAFALLSDGSSDGRWSYVGRKPSATFRDLDELRGLLSESRLPVVQEGPPFQGGAVGLASYEWAATRESGAPQARRPSSCPDLIGGLYAALAAFDHHRLEVWTIGIADTAAEASRQAECMAEVVSAAQAARPPGRLFTQVQSCSWDVDYPEAVAKVIEAIGKGEIFQANIARGWTGRLGDGDGPFDLLAALHAASPAPFAGYLRLEQAALISRSPERFLKVSAEGEAVTSPIKGTRPRGADEAADRRLAAELLSSEKDRAENLMIVDVMRNDLARCCRPGSVRVEALCSLTSFSNVHHLVSTVLGRLAPGKDALGLFASAFPPASVTGAPKLQAMKVIARHEPPRGPYCGSLFWAGFDGAFDSNVLIRSLALDLEADGCWRWEARAGAGIVADSDPLAEDAEAAQKARAVLTGFAS